MSPTIQAPEFKRTRSTQDVLEVELTPKSLAWDVDKDSLFVAPIRVCGGEDNPYARFANYDPQRSLIVLCVIRRLDIQYHLLWYIALALSSTRFRSLSNLEDPATYYRNLPHFPKVFSL